MRAIARSFLAMSITLFTMSLVPASAQETGAIALSAFKFNVPSDQASLVGNEDGRLFFYVNAKAEAPFKVAAEGDVEIEVSASGDPAQGEKAKFKVLIDDKMVGSETALTSDDEKAYSFKTKLKAGDHKVAIEYTNDVYMEGQFDRNFYLYAVKVKKGK